MPVDPLNLKEGALNDWKQWSVWVLQTLQSQEATVKELVRKVDTLEKQLTVVLIKISLFSSIIAIAASIIAQYFLRKAP